MSAGVLFCTCNPKLQMNMELISYCWDMSHYTFSCWVSAVDSAANYKLMREWGDITLQVMEAFLFGLFISVWTTVKISYVHSLKGIKLTVKLMWHGITAIVPLTVVWDRCMRNLVSLYMTCISKFWRDNLLEKIKGELNLGSIACIYAYGWFLPVCHRDYWETLWWYDTFEGDAIPFMPIWYLYDDIWYLLWYTFWYLW